MTGQQIRSERAAAGIAGELLAKRAEITRARLSSIERGYVEPTPEEAARLDQALGELLAGKARLAAVAAEVGLPV